MFVEAIKLGFARYFDFRGRSPRWQFWYWCLFAFIVTIIAAILDTVVFSTIFGDNGPLETVVALALAIPGIAIGVRRLHDIDRTGWWLLLTLTLIGLVVIIYFHCLKGTEGPNRFGPDPLA